MKKSKKRKTNRPSNSAPARDQTKETTSRTVARTAAKLVWVVPVVIAAMEMLPRVEAAISPAPRLMNVIPTDLLALVTELEAELA